MSTKSRAIRLSKLHAINWYGYQDTLPVQGNLVLAGVTGSGKSILMGLLMLVLVGSAAGYWYWKKHNAALDHPLPVDVATKPTPPPAKPVAPNKPAPCDPTKPAPIVVNNGPTQSTDVAPIPPTNTTTGPMFQRGLRKGRIPASHISAEGDAPVFRWGTHPQRRATLRSIPSHSTTDSPGLASHLDAGPAASRQATWIEREG